MEERLQRLEDQAQHLTKMMESSLAWQRKLGEFVEEMSPVARAMMDTGIQELAGFEQRGYFVFARDLAEALNRVVETYEPNSLPDLADAFTDIVYILRLLSRPRILAAAQDLVDDFDRAGSQPVEVLGAAKRIETEKDIQRGLAFALDLFGTLGRSVSRAPRLRTGRTLEKIARARRVPSTAAATVSKPEGGARESVFVSDEEWSHEWAVRMAQSLAVGPLNEQMLTIIEFSRKEYKDTQKAPNLRRMTKALGISTKEIYALFPSTPGPTISKIAGVPKPAGCL